MADTLQIPSADTCTCTFTWTESQVVLEWLQGNTKSFKPFIENGITKMLKALPIAYWGYVCFKENPAVCASRGMFPSQVAQYELWWQGPQWLKNRVKGWAPETEFPEHPIPSEEKELKQSVSFAQPVSHPLLK